MAKKKRKVRRRAEVVDFLPHVPLPRAVDACKFPGCTAPATHPHHVTYRPPCVFKLCAHHHREITVCNVNRAELTRCRLTNRHRWWIWGQWVRGELRPDHASPAAVRWMRDFRD